MIITINGSSKELPQPLSVKELLEAEGYGDMLVAIACNGIFLARTHYNDTLVAEGDEIEIVAPMQGG